MASNDLITLLGERQASPPAPRNDRRTQQCQRLNELMRGLQVFHECGVDYCRLPVDGHLETRQLRDVRSWLVDTYTSRYQETPLLGAVKEAMDSLSVRASAKPGMTAIRIHGCGEDEVYVDLCNSRWESVRIDRDGYQVGNYDAIAFRRPSGMLELSRPEPGSDINCLRPFLNCAEESDFHLLVAWLLGAFMPKGPFPALMLSGSKGSAKSTTAKVLRSLVDPSLAMLASLFGCERDLYLAMHNSWVLAYDNLSRLKPWESDALARIATDGGMRVRKQYSDLDEIVVSGARPIVLTGIECVAVADDLLDRALLVELPAIDGGGRRDEKSFWSDFDEARPKILGALFSAVRCALKNYDTTKPDLLPRMADHARWVLSAEPALGLPEGAMAKALLRNESEQSFRAMVADPVAGPVLSFMAAKENWEGTVSELRDALLSNDPASLDLLPATPAALGTALNRASTTLSEHGLLVLKGRNANRRLITLAWAGGDDSMTAMTGDSGTSSLSSSFFLSEKEKEEDVEIAVTTVTCHSSPSLPTLPETTSQDSRSAQEREVGS